MNDDQQQLLKSKYERLCVEFKKLRTKYKALKDNENEIGQQLQENLLKKDAHIKRLQEEIENLKSHLPFSSNSCDEGHDGLHHHHHLNGVMINDSNHLSRKTTSSCLSPTESHPFTHTTHQIVENDSGKFSDQVNPDEIPRNTSTSCSTKAVCTDVGVQTESFVGTVSSTLNAATTITVPVSTSDEMSIINKWNSQSSPVTENQVTANTEQQDPLSLERHNTIDNNEIDVNQNSLNMVSTSSMNNEHICQSVKHLQSESNTSTAAADHPASSISTSHIPSSFPCSNSSSMPLVSSPPTTLSPSSSTLPTSVHQGNNDNSLIEQFINLLNNWINSLQINKNLLIIDKEKINKILTNRIGQLESQLCEISLKYQMERKRRLKEQQHLAASDEDKNANNSVNNNSCSDINECEQSTGSCNAMTNLRNSMIQRIALATEEAIYFASRANFLQDELESLMPWISQLVRINQKQQLEITRLGNHINELKEQLELTKTNTVKQVNEMAKHMANLTDELQCLRHDEYHHHQQQQQQQQINCISSPSSNDNSSKKLSNTLFSVLKR